MSQILFLFLFISRISAAAGDLDTSFKLGVTAVSKPLAIAVQPDGKILIGGSFDFVDGVGSRGLARLNTDGSLDTSFNVGAGITAHTQIQAIALQPDGKIMIGGEFSGYNDVISNKMARLNPDGSLDPAFTPHFSFFGFGNGVADIAVQPDGKIIAVGGFIEYGGATRDRVVRMNADGSLDESFDPGVGPDSTVVSVALQSDGKIVIGGAFSQLNGNDIRGVARLNANGTSDSSFNIGTGVLGSILDIEILPDQKILIGGAFSQFNGTARNSIAKLNTDGTFDTGFTSFIADPNITVSSIKGLPDGTFIVGGTFTSGLPGPAFNHIVRMDASGTVDFGYVAGITQTVPSNLASIRPVVAVQPDGKALVSAEFDLYDNTPSPGFGRFNTDGTLDAGFNADPGGAGGGVNGILATVNDILVKPDGKVLVAGAFRGAGRYARYDIAQYNANGTIDTNFVAGNGGRGTTQSVNRLLLQPDGKILVGTSGQLVGSDGYGISRLNADGSRDQAFAGGVLLNVQDIVVQPADQKIIVVGTNGAGGVVRFDPNGAADTSFANLLAAANGPVMAVALQMDRKMIVGGNFTTFAGTNVNRLVRLNADGTIDSSFNPGGLGPGNQVNTIKIQPDGKMLIGGYFTTYNGVARNCLARLNADGSLDTSLNSGIVINAPNFVNSIAVQQDGRIVIGGYFFTYDNATRNGLARINADGSLDSGFAPVGGTIPINLNSDVNTVAMQQNGNILAGGAFFEFNEQPRAGIARVLGGGATTTSIGGAVQTSKGMGISRITITLMDTTTGVSRTAVTNGFGNFSFADVRIGDLYILEAGETKRCMFPNPTQSFTLSASPDEILFIGVPYN